MKRFRTVAAVALAGVLGAGTLAEAQGPRPVGPFGREHGAGARGALGGLPVGTLNLTQAQQDLIRDIRERHRANLQQVEATLRAARLAQQKAVNAIPADEGAIRAATLAAADAEAEIAVEQARLRSEIYAALTPEQQQRVTTALAEREQRMQQREQRMQQRQSQARERRGRRQ